MKWEKNLLGELVKSYGGKIQTGPFGSQLHQHDYKSEGIPVVMPKDIINDRIETGTIARINDDDADRLGKHKLNIGDLVLPRRGDINKRAICRYENEGWLCGTGCLKIRLNDEIVDPKYLYYYFTLSPVVESILNKAVGSTMLNLSGAILSTTEVVYPPILSQRKIASILSAYDDLIENNLKRVKLLEEKLMIEYSLLEDESKNLKEFDFSNFVTFVKGIEPGSSNYLSEKTDGTLPFIRVGDLSKRESDLYVEESKSKGIICNPNDVLISMDGTVGIVRYGIYGCYSSGIRKAVSNGLLNNALIFCYLSSKKIQGVIYSHSKGSTIQHAGSSINHFKIKLPKETSLNDFIKFSNPIYYLMNNLLRQNTKLREARDVLLPKLMNGQIEV
jgi:type I restriction enzyme S subunit